MQPGVSTFPLFHPHRTGSPPTPGGGFKQLPFTRWQAGGNVWEALGFGECSRSSVFQGAGREGPGQGTVPPSPQKHLGEG